MPLSRSHPYLCTFHARKDAKARAIEKAGRDIAFDLSGRYVSACDFSSALAHCITAVAQRTITPRAASSIAYLSQTLVQSIGDAESEYMRVFGVDAWKRQVAGNFSSPRPEERDQSPALTRGPARVRTPTNSPTTRRAATRGHRNPKMTLPATTTPVSNPRPPPRKFHATLVTTCVSKTRVKPPGMNTCESLSKQSTLTAIMHLTQIR